MNELAVSINPFTLEESSVETDQRLVADALSGNQSALESLVARHQPWIYNLAFRMVMTPQDAEDVSQEILVKMLTKLGSYNPSKGSFRTWLYRVVTNHVINMKSRGYESAISGMENYYSFVEQIPDQDPDVSPETELVISDLAIGCVMGILLCLDRTQRVVFLMAIAFGASDRIGSDILGISPENFRKILSRTRAKLHQYMHGNCGIVNPEAPCRCRKKVKSFIDSGAYSADRLTFLAADRPKLEEIVGETVERFNREIYVDYAKLYQSHPFYTGSEATAWLRELLQRQDFKEIFKLEEPPETMS